MKGEREREREMKGEREREMKGERVVELVNLNEQGILFSCPLRALLDHHLLHSFFVI
jgi:hypothetical protein